MAFTDTDMEEDDLEVEEEQSPNGRKNRNFWILIGVMGGILLLALICMGVYAVTALPAQRERRISANATIAAQATQISFAATQTAFVPSATPTDTRPTNTPPPPATSTPVMAMVPTRTATSIDEAIATRSALMTLAAQTPASTALPTSTLLPGTGFADDMGIPGLLALAAVFVVLSFLVRRLRLATPKTQ
jgi:hypothetical protein